MSPGRTMTRRELTAARMNRGLSVEAAAMQIGIAHNTLRRFEAGESILLANAKLIADFYGCKVTDLLPLDPEPAPTEKRAA